MCPREARARPLPFLVKGVIIALKRMTMSMNQLQISYRLTVGNAGTG
jgi:hypothetical protein